MENGCCGPLQVVGRCPPANTRSQHDVPKDPELVVGVAMAAFETSRGLTNATSSGEDCSSPRDALVRFFMSLPPGIFAKNSWSSEIAKMPRFAGF
jgi:hypothetical protein